MTSDTIGFTGFVAAAMTLLARLLAFASSARGPRRRVRDASGN